MTTFKTITGIGLLACTLLQSAWAQEHASCEKVRFAEIG